MSELGICTQEAAIAMVRHTGREMNNRSRLLSCRGAAGEVKGGKVIVLIFS